MANEGDLLEFDSLSGVDFEKFVVKLLERQGFTAKIVGGSDDKGVDVVAERGGLKYAIQCKRYASKVSRSAVSDCVAGMRLYKCDRSMVITNSSFHDGAIVLAAANDGILVGRPTLLSWIAGTTTEVETFVDAAESVRAGDIEVRILSAEIGNILIGDVEAPTPERSTAVQLLLRVQLRNDSKTRKYNFRSWGMKNLGVPKIDVELKDEYANEYRLLTTMSFQTPQTRIPTLQYRRNSKS
ncbi:MAG TPA: restriction endonuclease [Tepidisphaeraceae bacterium]|jgi:hypothetical protein|nr:restriction endonuclease [Tepidisphaeraceae bacterium]